MKKIFGIHKYNIRPIIQFEFVVPFLHIYTSLYRNGVETLDTEYVIVYIKIFKWKFNFRLYDHYRHEILKNF